MRASAEESAWDYSLMQLQAITSGSRLGLDTTYYLPTLSDDPPTCEPLLTATGGLPLAPRAICAASNGGIHFPQSHS